jgi:glycosyltransferase involved in cell wall biosynthesis
MPHTEQTAAQACRQPMNNPNFTSVLLIDHLNRALQNPTASQRWHALLETYVAETNEELRSRVRARLAAGVPKQGIAGFMLTTFLFEVTGDVSRLIEAAALLQTITPLDPDRLMAFCVYIWGIFIARGGGRLAFVDILRKMCVPQLVASMGVQVAERGMALFPPRPVETIRKVALVASYIGQDSHAPTPLALQHARLLRDLGYEVRLFSPQELRVPDMAEYFGNSARLTTFPPNYAKLKASMPDGVEAALSDDRFSLTRRWDDLLRSIAGFDPDLVMFVGLNSPLVSALYQARPVLGLCVHAMQPMTPVDVWLTADQAQGGIAAPMWAPHLPPALGHYHPFRVQLKPAGDDLQRAGLDLREDAIVLLSVGARLHAEIEGPWAGRMIALLQRHPNVQWLMVGGAAKRPDALAALSEAQLPVQAYREDIRSVMRTADIYVNPPRVGGGFSVAEAMAEGLPVTAMQNSDGGDKIGSAAADGLDAYFADLEALIADAGLRQRRGAAMRELFTQTLDLDNSSASLRAACEASLAQYRKRIK